MTFLRRVPTVVWQILGITLLWRGWLLLVGWLADRWLPYAPTFPYYDQLAAYSFPRWWYSWANFDGVHYLTIVNKGYVGTALIQAFFPLYPITIEMLHRSTGLHVLQSGLAISLVGSLVGMIVWFALLAKLTSRTTAQRWWWLVLLFPTSFFLTAFYTESLFMLFVWASFYAAITKRWWWAAFFVALASATRITGVLLIPALWLEWWWQQHSTTSNTRTFTPLVIVSTGATGLLAYMFYLWRTFNDPLLFFHVQSEFGGGRQESLVLFPQVIWRYIKILATVRPINWQYYAFAQEFVLALGTLAIMLIAWKKNRPSILVFSLLAWVLPTLTGTFSSMPRYVLACPAVMVVLIMWLDQSRHQSWLKWLVLAGGLIWTAINVTLFIQGYWVA